MLLLALVAASRRSLLLSGAGGSSLRDLLGARDAALLQKPVLNIPPGPIDYPDWLEGTWKVSSQFKGYQFATDKVSKERIVANLDIPGFQKLSIAQFADVGSEVSYERRYGGDGGGGVREDRAFNLNATIGAHMRDPSIVTKLTFSDKNRATIELKKGGRNGERIELFTNSRRSQNVDENLFLCSESIRQVTLGSPTFSNPNVPRIIIGEYQHFWTYSRRDDALSANVLTAAYVEPQDPMFQETFNDPVIVYSHNLQLSS